MRDLAKTAHDRELTTELHRVDRLFEKWRTGQLGPHELNDAIHEFHDGASRRLWKLYSGSDPRLAVASAIARGLLLHSEVPPDVAHELHSLITELSVGPTTLSKSQQPLRGEGCRAIPPRAAV